MIRDETFHTEKSIDIINAMHRAISNIFNEKELKSYEYVSVFLHTVSIAIEAMGFFPYHIIWEYIDEKSPIDNSEMNAFFLRDVTDDSYRNPPLLSRNDFFNEPIDEYLKIPISKAELDRRTLTIQNSSKLLPIFDLPTRKGYSYFNLPVFSWEEGQKNQFEPNWVLTLVYKDENKEIINSEGSYKFMKFFSDQISLIWKKFWESVANTVRSKVDQKFDQLTKEKELSKKNQIKIITEVLAEEFRSQWCGLFLFNEQKNFLQLEFDNKDIFPKPKYQLSRDTNAIITSFSEETIIRISGRERLINIAGLEPLLKMIEKKEKTEYCLSVPIIIGKTKIGVIVLLRSKPPFSEFVTNQIKYIQGQISDIILSYFAIQHRTKDLRNIIDQITAPVKAILSQVDGVFKGRFPKDKFLNQFKYIEKLSKNALKYADNFENMLKFDLEQIDINKEKLFDLRDYLIGLAIEHKALIKSKCIHINVTKETPTGIDLFVDKDLFHRLITNILDNAIKYSFSPEERDKLGFQAKPSSMSDIENILLSAIVRDDKVVITVSSLGLEIHENESEKIFEKEFRGAMAVERFPVGTGIGLYIAKKIIESHNGTLKLIPGANEYNNILEITIPIE